MNNVQKFIVGEFESITKQSDKTFKPALRLHACTKQGESLDSCFISITWEQLEQIKQVLIASDND